MKNTKRTMSFLFATVLVMLFTLIASIGVAADSGVDPVIIDFSSQAAAEEYVNFTSYPPNTVKDQGYYTFNTAEGALSILPTESVTIEGKDHGTMRYSLKPNAADLFIGTPYMVVTYKTNISDEPLRMYNLWGHFCTLASDIGVSNGNYVKSEPINIDISPVSSVNANYFNRFNNGMHYNMISIIDSSVPSGDPYFYIKEVAFFATQEEADAYSVNPVYPVFADLSSQAAAESTVVIPTADTSINGNVSFNEEAGALSLGYSTATDGDDVYNNYHVKFGIRMAKPSLIANGQKYMVVTYKTNIDTAVPMKLSNLNGNWHKVLETDVSVSNGNWVHSAPIDVSTGNGDTRDFYFRWTAADNNVTYTRANLLFLEGINSEADFEGKYFYIKEIAFFPTKEEADAYAVDPVIINFSSQAAAEKYVNFTAYPPNTVKDQGYYTFDTAEGALSILPTESVTIEGKDHGTMRYSLKPNAAGLFTGTPYMVVTYKTNISNEPLRMYNLWGHFCTLASDIGASNGKYVRTEPFNIDISPVNSVNSNYFNRFNNGMHYNMLSIIDSSVPNGDPYFYIKEVAFFESAEAAEEWYAQNPIEPEEPEEPEVVYGDADGDGETTIDDLANFGRALAKWKDYVLPEDESVLDLNSDGKVNPLDLVYLARHIAGWDGYKVLPIA